MRKIFKEYHQFTDQEFKQLCKDCLFVFDTNTLLNMYRYSRTTVDAYFDVLNALKNKKQLWIPYQVGYEFYENRIDVISEYEKSYDEILLILETAKNDIESRYKDHPFLDLCKIKEGINKRLDYVETEIKEAKNKNPKWLKKDEVLEKINQLFDGNIGNNYNEQRLNEIKKEGKERYEKKIPPGFKDAHKNDDKKYGDLILWYQIIDEAKRSKKPIVLISGDIKEDWWLKKDGKKLMPLPQLKKELSDKAGVDFHIYTADRFLKLNKADPEEINNVAIDEVRRIRELEETKMIRSMELAKMMERKREVDPKRFERYAIDYIHVFNDMMMKINESEIHPRHIEGLYDLFGRIRELRNRIVHGKIDRITFNRFYRYTKEISFILDKIIHSEEIDPKFSMIFRECLDILEHLNQRFRIYM